MGMESKQASECVSGQFEDYLHEDDIGIGGGIERVFACLLALLTLRTTRVMIGLEMGDGRMAKGERR